MLKRYKNKKEIKMINLFKNCKHQKKKQIVPTQIIFKKNQDIKNLAKTYEK
jgi:hypothetical protein